MEVVLFTMLRKGWVGVRNGCAGDKETLLTKPFWCGMVAINASTITMVNIGARLAGYVGGSGMCFQATQVAEEAGGSIHRRRRR